MHGPEHNPAAIRGAVTIVPWSRHPPGGERAAPDSALKNAVHLAAKLQLKPGQPVAIVNAPEDAALELADNPIAAGPGQAGAVIVYCANQAELERLRDDFVPPARRDALTWVAYPKARQLDTDLTRDVLARLVQAQGVQPVRQISLDDVWSALRLRPA
jgi:hypothetical protein